MTREGEDAVPADFPQEFLATVSGAQPKLLLERSVDGNYVDCSQVQRRERWLMCADLREQLVDYVHKHRPSETALEVYAVKVTDALERKRAGWGISAAEAAWIAKQLKAHFAAK